MLRRLEFEFTENVHNETIFNKENRTARPHWLKSFVERHTELSPRQAEGLSLARAHSLIREEVHKMFDLVCHVLTEHELLDKPDRILNIDETCAN